MTGEITIPLLPCRSINDLLEFYRALGFEVTYQQAKPNNYAVVSRGGIELYLFSMREFDSATSYSSCCVRVHDPRPDTFGHQKVIIPSHMPRWFGAIMT